MNILLVTETLVTGGAETFVLRMASALHSRGEQVALYVLRGDEFDQSLVESIAPGVPIKLGRIPFLKFFLKIDGMFFMLGSRVSLVRWLQAIRLRSYLVSAKPDIIHSHLFTSDTVTALATKTLAIPWLTTMHGDYLAYEKLMRSRAARIINFSETLSAIEKSVAHMVCITDPQMKQLSRSVPTLAAQGRISKIYNGYASTNVPIAGDIPQALRDIPLDAFVIGMVARGVRDKGWDVLISAFLELNLSNSWLVLVGDGEYIQQIKPSIHDNRIIFTGNVVDPLRYISRFDVGCLPSRFKSESLPTVVIEYLYLGKPIIATRVGEVSIMLDVESDTPAGLLIELDSVEEMVKEIKIALQQLYTNKVQYEFFKKNTASALRKFDMGMCIDSYLAIYRDQLNA